MHSGTNGPFQLITVRAMPLAASDLFRWLPDLWLEQVVLFRYLKSQEGVCHDVHATVCRGFQRWFRNVVLVLIGDALHQSAPIAQPGRVHRFRPCHQLWWQ